jgi:hypothetical protein
MRVELQQYLRRNSEWFQAALFANVLDEGMKGTMEEMVEYVLNRVKEIDS